MPMPPQLADPALRVLVVDDEPLTRMVSLRLLKQLGHHADGATNGEEAVAAVGRDHYDVVLMDVHMPVMDGCEATRRIYRDIAADRRPRIVAVTASAGQEDLVRCLEVGMYGHIVKPMSRTELVGVLRPGPPEPLEIGDRPSDGLAEEIAAMVDSIGVQRTAEAMAAHLDWALGLFAAPHPVSTARLGEVAHALRSTSRLFGFQQLADRCEQLDEAVRTGQPVDAPAGLAELRGLMDESVPILAAAIAGLRGAGLR